jgi:hypothetical protein
VADHRKSDGGGGGWGIRYNTRDENIVFFTNLKYLMRKLNLKFM